MKQKFTTTKEIETFINSFPGATYHYYHYNTVTKEEKVFFRATDEAAKKISEELGIEVVNTSTRWHRITLTVGIQSVTEQ